jgi:hypothetical protein
VKNGMCKGCGAALDAKDRNGRCRACDNRRRRETYHDGGDESLRFNRMDDAYARLNLYALLEQAGWSGQGKAS